MDVRQQIPLTGRIIVEMDSPEEKTKSGIIIKTMSQKITTGTVIKTGKNCKYTTVGSRVIIDKFDGLQQEHDGKLYYAMLERELACVIQ